MSSDLDSTSSDVVRLHKENVANANIADGASARKADWQDGSLHRRRSVASDAFIEPLQSNSFFVIDKSKPETFLNHDDLAKVTESKVYPQKRLFRWFHSKKMPPIPETLDERKVYPLNYSNIVSRLFFLWILPIMRVGYKRTLQPNDLWKMDEKMSIERLYQKFDSYMEKYLEKARQKYKQENPGASDADALRNAQIPRLTIVKALFMTFKLQYSLAVLYVCIANAVSALIPLVTKRLISFVEQKTLDPSKKVNAGIGYAIGSVVLLLINGLAFNHFFHFSSLTGVEVKALLTKAILHKALRLSPYSKHKFPNGKVTSLMSTDVSRLELAVTFQPFLFAFPVVVIICLVLLIVNLGPIALVGIGIFICVIISNFVAFKSMIKYRIAANRFTDKRVGLMREILNSIKMIKYYAWEEAYEKNVKEVRAVETKYVRMMQLTRNVMTSITLSFPNVASMVTFLAMYKVNNGGRSPANIFSSLSLFQVLTLQMFFLPLALSTGIDAYIGLGRVQELLIAEEEVDTYIENKIDLRLKDDVALKVQDASFEWFNYELEDAKVAAKAKGETLSLDENLSSTETEKDSLNAEKVPFHGFHHLNFEIKKNEFIIITGPIGTGKSSLLSALSGFMRRTDGSVGVNGELLLCGYPWVQNASVRDNILFGSPFDKEKYDEVIRICSLQADLDILPAGDKTEIGERGITLSGGQKARITLARSVYKNVSIYLFDDVLSAVDSRVCKHIVEECMMGYLKDKTRILATHQLSLIDRASRVIYLGSDGTFDIGTVPELSARNQGFLHLMKFQTSQEEEEDSKEDLEELFDEKFDANNGPGNARPVSVIDTNKDKASKPGVDGDEEAGRLTEKEERAVNGLSIQIYKQYLLAGCGKITLLLMPIFGVIVATTTFCTLFSSVWLSFWTEYKFSGRSEGFYMGLYVFFVIFGLIAMCSQFTTLCLIGNTAAKRLNLKALHRLLHTPMSFMDTTPIGRVLNRFTKDTDTLDNEITESIRLFVYQTANLLGVVIMCIIYLPWFAIAIPFLVFLYLFVADHYQASGREIKRMEAIQRSFVFNNFNEILGGMDTIKAYRSEQRFLMKSDFLINKMNEAGYLVTAIQRWVGITLDILAIIFALLIALLSVTRQFSVNAGSVGVMLTYVLQLPGLLNALLRAQTQTENDMNSAERLVAYATDLPLEAQYRKMESQPPKEWPQNGSIKFENLSLSYRPGLPLVLKDINLDISGGEKIGICGRTGAGKSTIVSALYRLVEFQTGRITIDGIDINTLGLYDLRHKLSIIPQDPVLFKGNIRKNLDPFQECNDDELWDALVRGGAITKEELPRIKAQHKDSNGLSSEMYKFHLDQEVEDDGSNFSLGERQVLALTRALVRGSKILILDEATSSVDYETDANIQASIVKEFSNCTILCIAHRLKTILHYDRILVLDEGRVAEFDTPSALFKDHNTIFHEMCLGSGIVASDFPNSA